jgi:hypothetical protein
MQRSVALEHRKRFRVNVNGIHRTLVTNGSRKWKDEVTGAACAKIRHTHSGAKLCDVDHRLCAKKTATGHDLEN